MSDQRSRTGKGNDTPDPASDSLTLDQHRQRMNQFYADYDNELANAWRGR
jgi:hypothetical protein